jgi:hypothetical protein
MLVACNVVAILFRAIALGLLSAVSVVLGLVLGAMPSEHFSCSVVAHSLTPCAQYADQLAQHPDITAPQQAAAAQLVHRLLGSKHEQLFLLYLDQSGQSTGSTHGWFSVQVVKGKVHIHGTSGVELASGVHHFLKYFAGASVSWHATGGLQLSHDRLSPAGLAAMEAKEPVRVERAVPFSFYQNVVTMSYSMAFWDWDR